MRIHKKCISFTILIAFSSLFFLPGILACVLNSDFSIFDNINPIYLYIFFFVFPALNFKCKNYSSNRIEYAYICVTYIAFASFLSIQIEELLKSKALTVPIGELAYFTVWSLLIITGIAMVSLLVQYLLGHQNIRHNLESSDATDFDKITVALRNQVPLCWFTVAMFLKLPVNLASIDFFYDDFLLAILAIEFVKMVGSPLIPATASCIYRACQQAEKKQPSA